MEFQIGQNRLHSYDAKIFPLRFLLDVHSIRNMLQRRSNKNIVSTNNGQTANALDSSNDNCADVDSNSAGNNDIDNNNMSAQSQSDLAANTTTSDDNKLTVPKSGGSLEIPGLK